MSTPASLALCARASESTGTGLRTMAAACLPRRNMCLPTRQPSPARCRLLRSLPECTQHADTQCQRGMVRPILISWILRGCCDLLVTLSGSSRQVEDRHRHCAAVLRGKATAGLHESGVGPMGAQQRLKNLGGDPGLAARPCVDRKPLGIWHPQDAPLSGVQLLLHHASQVDPGIIMDTAIDCRCHTVELFLSAHCLPRGSQRDCGTHRKSRASEVVAYLSFGRCRRRAKRRRGGSYWLALGSQS